MSCLVAHEEKEGWHRMRIWMKKYIKRFLCQKFFLFLLIALPFFTYLYSYAVHQKSTKVKVGIVADKDNVFVREIQEELLSKTGMIIFRKGHDSKNPKGRFDVWLCVSGYT